MAGERGPKGDHGQQGEHGVKGEPGATGDKGASFSRSQVLAMFLFVVIAFSVVAYRTEHNSSRLDKLDRQVSCLQVPATCGPR